MPGRSNDEGAEFHEKEGKEGKEEEKEVKSKEEKVIGRSGSGQGTFVKQQ